MSLINEYRTIESNIKALQQRLEGLSQDSNLQRELEFEGKLHGLMENYQKSAQDVLTLLQAGQAKAARTGKAASTAPKRIHRAKQYRNPHTGETIETKGGNHKLLKEWKNQWGAETVESWATIQD